MARSRDDARIQAMEQMMEVPIWYFAATTGFSIAFLVILTVLFIVNTIARRLLADLRKEDKE